MVETRNLSQEEIAPCLPSRRNGKKDSQYFSTFRKKKKTFESFLFSRCGSPECRRAAVLWFSQRRGKKERFTFRLSSLTYKRKKEARVSSVALHGGEKGTFHLRKRLRRPDDAGHGYGKENRKRKETSIPASVEGGELPRFAASSHLEVGGAGGGESFSSLRRGENWSLGGRPAAADPGL